MKHFILLGAMMIAALPSAGADCNREQGKRVFEAKCSICHTADKRHGHTFGPNLATAYGRKIGKVKGFSFSPALAPATGAWDAKTLDAFLTDPSAVYPGTAMVFGGVQSEEERAAVICYLRGK